MASVQHLKELVGFVLDLGEAISDSYADGKISITDTVHFVSVFQKIGPALDGISEIPAEVGDLEQSEIDEIMEYVREEFDLDDDELEEKVEMGLEVGLKLAKFIGSFIS